MTSTKKIAANRINSQRSRGPRTAVGKGRVSYNAFRHGLASLKHLDPMLPRDIELMARALCGDSINPLLLEQARVIAESELLLRCVRAERIAVIERLRDVTAVPLAIRDDSMARAKARLREFELAAAELEQMESRFNALTDEEREKLYEDYDREAARLESKNAPVEERDEIDAMHEAIPDLNRLARYERRAWSRRKRAMWNFIDIRINEIRGLTGFGAAPTSEIGWRSPWPCPDRQRP